MLIDPGFNKPPREHAVIDGLTKAYEIDCGGIGFALWYSPYSDVAHMRDEAEDFARDRFVMVVTNDRPPAVRSFAFTEPKPLADFARLFRKVEGNWVDITARQISSRDSGYPNKRSMRFGKIGESWASTVVYPAFTTIASLQDLSRGEYLLRLSLFPYLEAEGRTFMVGLPDLPIEVE